MLSEVLKPKSIWSYIFFLISHSSISLLSFKCFCDSSFSSEKACAFSMTVIFNNHFDLIMSRQKKKSRCLWPQQIFIIPSLQHLERGQKFCWDNSINLFPLSFCLTQSKNTEKISWAMFSYEKAETNRCFLPPQVSLEEFIPQEGHQASLGCAMLRGHWENLVLKAPVSPHWPHYVADLETFSFEHWSSVSIII